MEIGKVLYLHAGALPWTSWQIRLCAGQSFFWQEREQYETILQPLQLFGWHSMLGEKHPRQQSIDFARGWSAWICAIRPMRVVVEILVNAVGIAMSLCGR